MVLNGINVLERMRHYDVSGLSMVLITNDEISRADGFGVLETGTDKLVNGHSVFNACSISKYAAAVLVMTLTEQGILDLDEDVNEKLSTWKVPENKLTRNQKVTLRRLLSHQSGVTDPEGSFIELDQTVRGIPSMVEMLEGKTPYCPAPVDVTYEPGSDFQYSDAGFCIIQQLIEDRCGKPFQQVMEDMVFKPLNMKGSTFDLPILKTEKENVSCGHNKKGELVAGNYPSYPYPAASGLWTTPSDLAALVIELAKSLKGESIIGLSAHKAEEMVSPQGCSKWTGLGVFLDDSEQEIEISSLGWGVGFQCMMVAYPYSGSGAVIMTNTDLGVHQLKGIIGEIYQSLSLSE